MELAKRSIASIPIGMCGERGILCHQGPTHIALGLDVMAYRLCVIDVVTYIPEKRTYAIVAT
jgi:hypothetical protein